jgi:hypothetical protein
MTLLSPAQATCQLFRHALRDSHSEGFALCTRTARDTNQHLMNCGSKLPVPHGTWAVCVLRRGAEENFRLLRRGRTSAVPRIDLPDVRVRSNGLDLGPGERC